LASAATLESVNRAKKCHWSLEPLWHSSMEEVLPSKPDWCENYAWAGYDPQSGIGHFFSMGRWIEDLNLWRSITHVALPGGRVLTSKNFGYGSERGPSSRELTYNAIEPKKRFRRFS
jgi:hypothetical protein